MCIRDRYHISPWGLSWDDENYYLVGYDSEAELIKHYRVDKMLHIRMSTEAREGKEHFKQLDMADYTKKSFGMFGGKEKTVKLLVDNRLAGVIIDRFGKDIMLIPADENHFTVNVDVHVSKQFLGWVFSPVSYTHLAVKVAENLEITENDKMLETAKMYTWSDEVNPKVETGGEMVTSVPENKLKVHKIGEDFTLSASGEDKDGNNIVNDKISAHVDSVQTADDLKLLNGADLPEEWENVINSNGKLVKNKVSYIKSGDGVNSVDRVIKTENVNQKLVYATVTYTNNSDQEIKHMLYIGNLALIRHENGEYHIYNAMEQSGNGYDRVSWDGVAHTAEMTYSSVREDYGNGGNYISSLKPGESIQVNMAWIVNEDNLADMYLNLDGEGGAYDFNEGMLEAGVVDIRK